MGPQGHLWVTLPQVLFTLFVLGPGLSLPCGWWIRWDWLASTREPPVSSSPALGLEVHTTLPKLFNFLTGCWAQDLLFVRSQWRYFSLSSGLFILCLWVFFCLLATESHYVHQNVPVCTVVLPAECCSGRYMPPLLTSLLPFSILSILLADFLISI